MEEISLEVLKNTKDTKNPEIFIEELRKLLNKHIPISLSA